MCKRYAAPYTSFHDGNQRSRANRFAAYARDTGLLKYSTELDLECSPHLGNQPHVFAMAHGHGPLHQPGAAVASPDFGESGEISN